ncbi:hypothetical protein AAHE18_16G119600 [Arachis hypogaea]|nr:uncharacterized protein DS421_16g540380 [Arachis hypogaea]
MRAEDSLRYSVETIFVHHHHHCGSKTPISSGMTPSKGSSSCSNRRGRHGGSNCSDFGHVDNSNIRKVETIKREHPNAMWFICCNLHFKDSRKFWEVVFRMPAIQGKAFSL